MGVQNRPPEPAREESAAEKAAAELDRKRNDESAQLEKRVADVERRWTEMQTKVAEKKVAPTSGLRSEIQEDIKNVREAVADLKTTNSRTGGTATNAPWNARLDDIEEDVRRFAKSKQPAAGTAVRHSGDPRSLRIATRPIRQPMASESRFDGGATQERTRAGCPGDGVGRYTGARQQTKRGR